MNSDQKKLLEAVPNLEARMQQFLTHLGIEKKYKLNVNSDEWYDPGVEFDHIGVGVVIFTGDNEEVRFGAYATTYNPGVWRYRDGTGEPPSEDMVNIGKDSSIAEPAIIEAFKALIEWEINNLLEKEADEEAEKFWRA